jgi:hypothetical protein
MNTFFCKELADDTSHCLFPNIGNYYTEFGTDDILYMYCQHTSKKKH